MAGDVAGRKEADLLERPEAEVGDGGEGAAGDVAISRGLRGEGTGERAAGEWEAVEEVEKWKGAGTPLVPDVDIFVDRTSQRGK